MDTLETASCWLAGLVVIYWVVSLVLVWDAKRNRILLQPEETADLDRACSGPKISVIVAAKDEEQNIELCVQSMLDQDYPNFELIVVDDRSTDGTLKILQRLESTANGRLKVLHVQRLEKGWFGKNNAMREGVQASSGDWFCFIDADCWQTSRQTLSVAMKDAFDSATDFLTITPVLTMTNTWEKVVQPPCALTLMSWFHPQLVNDANQQTAYANGHFMLMSKACYETIGGHERVKNEMNEDILLARNTKRAGLKLRMADNFGLFRSRMYPGITSAWSGWSRIFCGCIRSVAGLLLTQAIVFTFAVLPWLCLAVTLIERLVTDSPVPWNSHIILWGGACLSQLLFSLYYFTIFELKKIWAVTFPLAGIFILTTLVHATLKRLRLVNTTWRGTTYRMNKRVEAPQE